MHPPLALLLPLLASAAALQPEDAAAADRPAVQKQSYTFRSADDAKLAHLATLIDVLEQLDVLDGGAGDRQNCYLLDRIVKSAEPLEGDGATWRVSLDLYVRQMDSDTIADTAERNSNDVDDQSLGNASADCGGISAGNKAVRIPPRRRAETDMEAPATNDTADVLDVEGSSFSEAVAANGSSKATENRGNGTALTALKTTDDDDDGQELYLVGGRRMSRTQLMVIISCSTVIGTFFIVAISLRIRNYVKRLRAETGDARGGGGSGRRPPFRAASVALRGSGGGGRAESPSQAKDSLLFL